MLVVLDEAHRAKNRDAKRTRAIQLIAAGEVQMLLLTGTPLRNNEHEAAVLLGLLDAGAATALGKDQGYTIADLKDCLGYFMIRRTKAEVLPELPEKTRQRIDIGKLHPDQMIAYDDALARARDSYLHALSNGKTEAEARQSMQGGIEQARTALGVAKVRGGEVVDLVLEIVQNKKCCVVFCAHHQVSDELLAQIKKEKLRVAIVDGRVPQQQRAKTVEDFQAGRLDVFIGGINAAGEAITLTRADTVIFVELDWVPAALLQAEDRIHRVGQKSNCQVIQLVARVQGENLDEMMVDLIGSKVARIGMVLNEDASHIIAGSIQSELHRRLLESVEQEMLAEVDVAAFSDESTQQKSGMEPVDILSSAQEAGNGTKAAQLTAAAKERKRGRPKTYVDEAPPTATERSKRSVKALMASGGKRIMLRLSPEANEALHFIMEASGITQETATINQLLITRKSELLGTST